MSVGAMTKRIDIISQNGATGEHYLVEDIARLLTGDSADMTLMGKNSGKKRWELMVPKAIEVIARVREFDE